MSRVSSSSPFLDFDRKRWRELRNSMPQVLTEDEVVALRGMGENVDLNEVAEVYLPLSRLISLQYNARKFLTHTTEEFLSEKNPKIPFVIAVAGSVAVGKSTTSRLLQVLLQRWESNPKVDLITTDGFLYPTAELTRRKLMDRKGFPESYDRRALLQFVQDAKSGLPHVDAPVYSHKYYDRIPGVVHTVENPDILIIEGLNVLQTGPTLMVSDYCDFSVYVDADPADIEQWYIDRFLELRHTSFKQPGAHFSYYADLDDAAATERARDIWQSINLPNLVENIAPTRNRANLVLRKGPNHEVQRVRMRRI